MTDERSKWLRLEEDDGWQIIIPETDIRPHSKLSHEEAKKVHESGGVIEVDNISCPCKPKIDFLGKLVIHNSFEDEERIQKMLGFEEKE